MTVFIEFLKINHIYNCSSTKLNRDVLEIIFEKYILSLVNNDDTYCIDKLENPNLYIIKFLYKKGYKCSSQTAINAIKNNNIDVLKWLLENNINIGYAMKEACINGNLEIIKLLNNNNIKIIKEYTLDALINNHYHILEYLIISKYIFNYKYLLLGNINYDQLTWILSHCHPSDIKLSVNERKVLVMNAINNNNLELLLLLKEHNLCIYTMDIIISSLKNIEIIKFFDKYVNELYYGLDQKNINIIKILLISNNIDIIEYYINSNKKTSIFKIFDNISPLADTLGCDIDLSYFILDDKIVKYIYSNEKCTIKLSNHYLMGLINDTQNISLLEWLCNNKYIDLRVNMIKIIENYDINKYIIDNICYSDEDKKTLMMIASNCIERGSLYLLNLCHNKIMTFEDEYIIEWESIHYDNLDYAYKYTDFDVISYMRNKDIWTKNGICYLTR